MDCIWAIPILKKLSAVSTFSNALLYIPKSEMVDAEIPTILLLILATTKKQEFGFNCIVRVIIEANPVSIEL